VASWAIGMRRCVFVADRIKLARSSCFVVISELYSRAQLVDQRTDMS